MTLYDSEILIIEDNPNDAELMLRSLKKNNLVNKITVIEDGADALDFIFCKGKYNSRDCSKQPTVIFLDLKLPKVDGLELLKKIKSDKKTNKIPVIVVSSSDQDPDIRSAYELGANSYVVKPVEFKDFVEKISQLGLYWLIINEKPR